MRIERLNFRDFESGADGAIVVARKAFLPGGRRKEEAPPPPPAPSFTEDQVKAAERDSYKKGFLEGTEEGIKQAQNEQAAINAKLVATVEQFARMTQPLINDYSKMILQLKQDMPKVAFAIAQKVAGNALTENAQAVVSEMALACAETMMGEPKISVTVHESMADTLERQLKDLATRMQSATAFVVVRDAAINPSDCKVEWKFGAMERHTGQLWQQVERIVESMVASANRATDTQIEQLEQQLPKE